MTKKQPNNRSEMLQSLREELAETERQLAVLEPLTARRIQLVAAIEAVEALEAKWDAQEKPLLIKGKRLVAGEPTGKIVRFILGRYGPQTLEDLVELMKKNGWKSTGNNWRDLKRAYFAMYNKKNEFRVKKPGNVWELIKSGTERENKNAPSSKG